MDEQDLTTSEDEDVEGHKLSERPSSESPTSERSSEEPDVEGHSLTERPSSEALEEKFMNERQVTTNRNGGKPALCA